MLKKLTSIKRYSEDKDGNPLKTKDGRNYTRLVIGIEGQTKTLSGFDSKDTADWVVGNEVEIEIEEKGEYLNFKVPKKDAVNGKVLETIQNNLLKQGMVINQMFEAIRQIQKVVVKDDYPYPEKVGLEVKPNGDIKDGFAFPEDKVDEEDVPF